MTQIKTQTPHRSSRILKYSPKSNDSPSRQLILDLERALGQIQLHETEVQRVRAFNRRSYYEDLDACDLARTQADIAALDASTARHDAVRQEAEAELQNHLRQVEEAERKRAAEEARIKRENEARAKAEQEQREREDAERKAKLEREKAEAVAAAKKAAEEKAKADIEEARRKEREEMVAREKAEKERADKEASERAIAEKVVADQRAAQEATAPQQTSQTARQQAASGTASAELEDIHNRYLELHQKLKKFRVDFAAAAKANPQLKSKVGDMRRGMRTSVGQLTDDKASNKKPTERVQITLTDSLKNIVSPSIQLQDYLPFPLADPSTTLPSLTLYLLTIFSKAIISAFVGECAVNPRAAESIGTLAAKIFSASELQFLLPNPTNHSPPPTTSLIPILLSKYHVVAPHLFGISTSRPNTTAGRLRMGWRREPTGDEKTFVPEQRQLERLTGLGAGFASIALRNFARTKLHNPYPPHNFWLALSSIVNTPAQNVEAGHLVLLKNMVEGGWERVILFWGNLGVAALRESCVEFPRRLPAELRDSPAGRGIGLMVEGWEKDKNFRLT